MECDVKKMLVVHKKTGEKLLVKRLYGNILVCESETERRISPTLKTKIVVCHINNVDAANEETV